MFGTSSNLSYWSVGRLIKGIQLLMLPFVLPIEMDEVTNLFFQQFFFFLRKPPLNVLLLRVHELFKYRWGALIRE